MKNDDKKAERMETGGRYFTESSREISDDRRIGGYILGACLGTLIAFSPMIGRDIYNFIKGKPAVESRARR